MVVVVGRLVEGEVDKSGSSSRVYSGRFGSSERLYSCLLSNGGVRAARFKCFFITLFKSCIYGNIHDATIKYEQKELRCLWKLIWTRGIIAVVGIFSILTCDIVSYFLFCFSPSVWPNSWVVRGATY